ncbi:SDR family NAD(P)-dependent oxidoreductase [Actinomycetospora sp. NBRC 106378]|jgi:uncharacterized oxidoreductase|uniref:SDR family NAD(P)-dependent oxidoreductase n=1 Tax=Actinomycetospora sp. NBRC 106378 TaxID=3032208 RepID=UPI0024A54928|nr:SDR family NAD(P)-dependent oxidoreductase [Actinomycetospora sp. NBRC 106378]GLZ50564.1 hypothetical protein Acsp07_01810 [Actinomycetospora sp. NBRC 106378]
MTTRQVLVTGGGRGIGLGLATRFRARGDRVIVTARSTAGLADAAASGLETVVADMARPDDRAALAAHVRAAMPGLDLVVQNAGGQRRIGLAADDAAWPERQAEIDTLLAGPVHLDSLLVPTMLAHGRPATVVEVTSGGAVVPQPFAPLYSASKAALHHYALILRASLADTAVRVVELMPPAVATGLGGSSHGADLDAFCDAAVAGIDRGEPVVGFGPTASGELRALVTAQQELFEAIHS